MASQPDKLAHWFLQGPGWLLFVYLVYAQGIPAFDYQLGVSMGTQEPADVVSEVGVAFWYGFAFADVLVYIPVLGVGLAGCWFGRHWGRILLAAALGITVYWPVVCLAALFAARDASGWNLEQETPYWVVLPIIAAWGLWGLFYLTATPFISKRMPNSSGPEPTKARAGNSPLK